METIEALGFGDLKLIQDSEEFKFGVDAIILADFANTLCPKAREIADLGTGNGIIPTVLSHKNSHCRVTGIDVQARAIELACKSTALNGLDERLAFDQVDIKDIRTERPEYAKRFDAVVTNPPYVEAGSGIVNDRSAKFIARQETTADLECFIRTAGWMLKDRGHFFIVQRPSRLPDIMYYCRKYSIEPKNMQFVTPHRGEIPTMVLLHGILGAGKELKILPELAVRESDGQYSSEIERIYER